MNRALSVKQTVFTPAMIAERWACSERHVRNMIDRGELRAFRLGGKLWRVRIADIEDYECRIGELHDCAANSPLPTPEATENADDSRSQPLTRARLNVLRLHSTRN